MKKADYIKDLEARVRALQKELGDVHRTVGLQEKQVERLAERVKRGQETVENYKEIHKADATCVAELLKADLAFQVAAVLRYGYQREDGAHVAHLPIYDVDELNAKYKVNAARDQEAGTMRVVVEKRETA